MVGKPKATSKAGGISPGQVDEAEIDCFQRRARGEHVEDMRREATCTREDNMVQTIAIIGLS